MQLSSRRWFLIELVGSLFLKHLRDAYVMRDKHRLIFHQFSLMFPQETVQKLEAKVLHLRRVYGGFCNLVHDAMIVAVMSMASGGWAESDKFSDADGWDDGQDTDWTDDRRW